MGRSKQFAKSVANLAPDLAGCFFKQDRHLDKGFLLGVLLCLTGIVCVSFPGSSLFADSVVQGLDPGFHSGVARQSRTQKRFFSNVSTGGVEYQLIAVAEQGDLQDSRPFEIVDLGILSKERYLQQSNDNVSPFYFGWNNSLGSNTATMEIDTLARPYFYRNDERLSSPQGKQSTVFRGLPRTVYHSIPANRNDPALPQLKNSLDDHVHLAMFEEDSSSPQESISTLRDLNYQIRLRVSTTELQHETNYQVNGSGQQVLKNRIGSRVVASILWSEDVNSDGQKEVYLVEINVGGRSNLPAWQSGDFCASDSNSHAHLISGQYLVLGASELLSGVDFPLDENQIIDLNVPWGDVLARLRARRPDQPCHLKASLQHVQNSIGLGVAIEAKGAVRQSLDVAAVILSTGQSVSAEPSVLTQTVSNDDQAARSVEAIIELETDTACLQPDLLPAGFYRFGDEVIYVNDPFRDSDAAAFCRMPADQANGTASQETSAVELCGLPLNRRDDGACNSLVATEPPSAFFDTAVNIAATSGAVIETVSDAETEIADLATELSLLGAPMVASGQLLLPAGPSWWQVLSASDWTDVCPSVNETSSVDSLSSTQSATTYKTCAVGPGRYTAINHTDNRRWDDLLVVDETAGIETPSAHASIAGRQVLFGLPETAGLVEIQESPLTPSDSSSGEKWYRLIWDQAGWYQVTDSTTYESICESASHCDLGEGVYTVIDLHSGRRTENVILLD